MKAKLRKIASISMLGLIGLTGCGGAGSNAELNIALAPDPEKPSGDEVLTVVASDDTSEGACFQSSLNKYADEYGIEINYIEAPYADAISKIQQMIMSGDTPDLVRLSGGYTELEDNVVDISNLIDTDSFNPALMQQAYYQKSPVAVPLNVTANGIIYNKELFEEAGISAPTFEDNWTWEQFNQNMNTLVDNSSAQYAWTMDFSEFRLATLFYTNDGSLYDAENKQITLNSPKNVAMVEAMLKQYDEGLAPKSVWLSGDDPSALFETGTVGLYLSGNWKVEPYQESLNFDWGVMPVPEGQFGTTTNIGGNYIYPLKDSKNAAIASDFIQWFYEDENYTEFLNQCSYLPAKQDTPAVKYDLNQTAQQAMDDFRKQSESISELSIADNISKKAYRINDNIIREEISKALNGEQTAQQAMDNAAQKSAQSIADNIGEEWTLAYPPGE